ncbi:DUF1223 domain-containing protein [Brevundimonas bacteroides]|uniref:DUF1223 domain-containing protein n=1 Tax=Brevundimonas bacteroides TaxID=74311 RepID=UPI000496549E|nr:DUF1223 domain-containing protein [Brevundimonas bacteroides]
MRASAQSAALRFDLRRRLSLLGAIGLVAAAVVFGHATVQPVEARVPAPPPADELTVVELFTSQGCNACPPANANLVRLSSRPDLLTLSFNVTYWDDLGWPDTFAKPEYTARQRAYQRGLGTDNVWTPQVVVDGRSHTVGRQMEHIERLIDSHLVLAGPSIAFRNGGVGLAGGPAQSAPADVWLVRYEPDPIAVPVARGENAGRTLPHASVVRELVKLGQWSGGQPQGWALPAPTRDGLLTAVLVQMPDGGPILRAAKA